MIEIRPSQPTKAEIDRMIRESAPEFEKRGIRVWLDPGILPPDRVLLTVRQLAQALGCPRDILRAYLGERKMHEASRGEVKAGLGLAAEQIAGLAMGIHVATKSSPPFWMETRDGGAARVVTPIAAGLGIWDELEAELYRSTGGMRVVLGVVASNSGTEVCVRTGTGDLDVPAELRPSVEFFDVTRLMRAMDVALGKSPLKFPAVRSCRLNVGA